MSVLKSLVLVQAMGMYPASFALAARIGASSRPVIGRARQGVVASISLVVVAILVALAIWREEFFAQVAFMWWMFAFLALVISRNRDAFANAVESGNTRLPRGVGLLIGVGGLVVGSAAVLVGEVVASKW